MIINILNKHYNYIVLTTFVLTAFFINLSIEYSKYQELIDEEIYETKVEVQNIYEKEKYDVLKLKNANFTIFTNFDKNTQVSKYDILNLAIITIDITFIEYLKGFYVKSVYFDKLEKQESFSSRLVNYSASQHHNEMITELFSALFFAKPISKELREVCTNYGISHLIALSGFHLAVLSFIIYGIVYYPYAFFHLRYFPYRNKRFDILLITLVLLFSYLIFTGFVASLTRAFVMMTMGIYLLRCNIKLFSFTTLFVVLGFVLALFPKYIFSLSLWFSIFGVFYIFLYIQYFKDIKNKLLHLLLFNFWIYLAMNPLVHYFFPLTTYEQMLSPFLTMAFTLFYPLELFAHIFSFGGFLDEYILMFLSYEFKTFDKVTSLWFLVLFMVFSFYAIFNKKAFYFLNILLFAFTVYLYI